VYIYNENIIFGEETVANIIEIDIHFGIVRVRYVVGQVIILELTKLKGIIKQGKKSNVYTVRYREVTKMKV